MAGFLVSIPVPPSANNLFANGKRGRFKTAAYKAWLERAGWEIKAQKPTPVTGPYRLFLSLPKIRGDASNRVKAAEDLLVSLGLIPDDRNAVGVHIEVLQEQRDFATVAVEPADTWRQIGDVARPIIENLREKVTRA